jgi:DNA-binding NarL/FixJ family response regulator
MTSILVVDDGETDRELVVTVLRYAGYDTLEAATGSQGLELARSERPDLIVADILMPTMDGYDLVRHLRADPTTADIRVIFYTATYVIEEARRLADAVGVSHILVKPCEPERIIRVVGEALAAPGRHPAPLPSEDFHSEHLRVINAKLLQKIEELRSAVLPSSPYQRPDQQPDPSPSAGAGLPYGLLSQRELEVLAAVADGATNAEIGERLVIAETTVQSHVRQILRKLGVRNRTEAAVRYLQRP